MHRPLNGNVAVLFVLFAVGCRPPSQPPAAPPPPPAPPPVAAPDPHEAMSLVALGERLCVHRRDQTLACEPDFDATHASTFLPLEGLPPIESVVTVGRAAYARDTEGRAWSLPTGRDLTITRLTAVPDHSTFWPGNSRLACISTRDGALRCTTDALTAPTWREIPALHGATEALAWIANRVLARVRGHVYAVTLSRDAISEPTLLTTLEGTTRLLLLADGVLGVRGPGDALVREDGTPCQQSALAATTAFGIVTRCDLGDDRVLTCRGYGNLGDGRQQRDGHPLRLDWLPPIRDVLHGTPFFAILDEQGTITRWSDTEPRSLRTAVAGPFARLRGARDLAVHGERACVRMGDQTVRCWGALGGIERGTYAYRALPIDGITDAASLALTPAGLYWQDTRGAIRGLHPPGVDDPEQTPRWRTLRHEPHERLVDADDGFYWVMTPTGLQRVDEHGPGELMLSAAESSLATQGHGRRCAVGLTQPLRCFGSNTDEAILHDRRATLPQPGVAVPGVGPALAYAFGSHSACVIRTDHRLACWGHNAEGQLGLGDRTDRTTPTLVAALGAVVSVAVGEEGACAVTDDGAVWCWGSRDFPQGHDPRRDHATPTRVEGIEHAAEIALGEGFVCARTTDGEVACWGNNLDGRLGDGTTVDHLAPTWVLGDPAR